MKAAGRKLEDITELSGDQPVNFTVSNGSVAPDLKKELSAEQEELINQVTLKLDKLLKLLEKPF